MINLIDKIVFGCLLILGFQVPILSDHYLQFLNGSLQATQQQVEAYQSNAQQHGYADVFAMIHDFKTNSNLAVRTDAEQKLQTLLNYQALQQGVSTLQNGHLLARAWYMLQPRRWQELQKVAENFSPSIPLNPGDVLISSLAALGLSMLLMWPLRRLFSRSAARPLSR